MDASTFECVSVGFGAKALSLELLRQSITVHQPRRHIFINPELFATILPASYNRECNLHNRKCNNKIGSVS